ncbi:MAG TPA: hypothetical protein VF593_05960 [Chthoniobacteraceae bacterium]
MRSFSQPKEQASGSVSWFSGGTRRAFPPQGELLRAASFAPEKSESRVADDVAPEETAPCSCSQPEEMGNTTFRTTVMPIRYQFPSWIFDISATFRPSRKN